MKIDVTLNRRRTRMTVIGATTLTCGSLLYLTICNFVVGALTDHRIKSSPDSAPLSFITAPFTDDRVGINPDVLASAGRFFRDSPRLHMRLAEVQISSDQDWSAADFHARQAVRFSPHDYRPRLMLALIQEANNDLQGEEESVRIALRLAPGNLEAHWLLGNLLVNTERLSESYEHFRAAGSGDAAYFDAALQRIWNVSDVKVSAVNLDALWAITPENGKDRLTLARFLLESQHPLESAAVFRKIGRDALITNAESGRYLDRLIAAGNVALAHELWSALTDRTDNPEEQARNLVSNGSFEADILVDFAQFDWSIQPSNHARISLDRKNAHSGNRSLRIDFIGHETTQLDEEIQQLILVKPGARYRLEFDVKTENLEAPDGPRVVLTATNSPEWIAASSPAPSGSNEWQHHRVEFSTSGTALVVAIKQRPRFSYEDPTYGTVWFDDFEIREVNSIAETVPGDLSRQNHR
jgi:tetratricopeptide (TPR) repeat protein